MFDAKDCIEEFRISVQKGFSENRRKKLIHGCFRQITLDDIDPEHKLYDRYVKAGKQLVIQYMRKHPFKIRLEDERGVEWVWFRKDMFEDFLEHPIPREIVRSATNDRSLKSFDREIAAAFRSIDCVQELLQSPVTGFMANRLMEGHVIELERSMKALVVHELAESLSAEDKVSILVESNNYTNVQWDQLYQRYRFLKEQVENIRRQITDRIPENPIDLYPDARSLKRHFILHVGPTNSGKTHDSLVAFREAERGVYLAPLRLMANEIYDQTNRLGVPCNMETGEEHIILTDAQHTACTIELMDPTTYYDVAVIDEAQMLEDAARGGNWTQAILGVCAQEIHVCMAPYAENMVKRLIELCDDSYEVVYHKRAVPLRLDGREFQFPENVQKGDALIVFSKKSVLYVAAELRSRKISCSVIYGALPYDVRSNEVERFASGQTDVVVATDAIGMGLNLPIRRIVFLETTKFDGTERRALRPAEIQQIAGRAGRYGRFDIGYYTSEYNREEIREAYKSLIPPIEYAYLRFPKTLLSIPSPISDLLEQWSSMENPGIFWKGDMKEEIKLCRELEELSDHRQLIYDFAMIPYDSENEELHDIWLELFSIAEADDVTYNILHYLSRRPYSSMDLDELEHEHKKIGLLLYYSWNHSISEYTEALLERKHHVCDEMIQKLSTQSYAGRTCPVCGRKLKWNWPYRVCDQCFTKQRIRRRS